MKVRIFTLENVINYDDISNGKKFPFQPDI